MDHTIVSPSRTGIGRLIVLVALLLVLLAVCAIVALPWLVNRPATIATLQQEFEKRTGHRLSIEQSHVRIFPSPRLTLTAPRLYDPAATTPLVLAERVEVALQWLPLLEGRLVAKDVVIDRPQVTIHRWPNGSWSLGKGNSSSSSSDSTRSFGLLQVVRNLLLVQGRVTLVDESASAPAPLQITVTQGALSSEMMGRRARLPSRR